MIFAPKNVPERIVFLFEIKMPNLIKKERKGIFYVQSQTKIGLLLVLQRFQIEPRTIFATIFRRCQFFTFQSLFQSLQFWMGS